MASLGDLLADLQCGQDDRAEQAALALPEYHDAAIAELSALLESGEGDARWWAVRALAEFSGDQIGDLLVASLGDEDPAVRHCAALALSKHPHAPAIPELIDLLENEDHLLARLAGDALVAAGKDAVAALIAVTEKSLLEGKTEAVRALALIGDTRAIPALFKLLDSDSAQLEHWVSEGLDKMGVGMRFFEPGS